VALVDSQVAVRDSKLPVGSPFVTVSRDAWSAFVAALKAGEYSLA
jgi:hypothetical protein